MNNKGIALNLIILIIAGVFILAGGAYYFLAHKAPSPAICTQEENICSASSTENMVYKNGQYGFSFSLPESWKGYSVVMDKWTGNVTSPNGDAPIEEGPIILIRHPQWTAQNTRQDIPIMIFTLTQWDSLSQDKFHIGAAPINPSRLGSNANYVFALPARYNYAFPAGWEEVEKILQSNPLYNI